MRLAGALAALASLAFSTDALAFCRTTTCDPQDPNQGCSVNGTTGCVETGLPLFWPQQCVSFSVQQDASTLRNIDLDSASSIITSAFQTWMDTSCAGEAPSLALQATDPVECATQEYNQDQPNANIIMFRDEQWPYSGTNATLALTTITFNVETGEIFDADIEINSAEQPLTTGNGDVEADLLSIITHEAGHFLGLSHTRERDATMFARYEFGTTGLRTLTTDDQQGMCDIYPPDRSVPACNFAARHGFSPACATEIKDSGCCSTAPGSSKSHTESVLALGLLGLGVAWTRRRQVKRRRAS